MSKLSLEKGRVNQKLETREIILDTTKSFLKENMKFSLEDVAKKANVSRATIYRYFSNVELLVKESSLDIFHLSSEELVNSVSRLTLTDRILFLQKYYNKLAQDHETEFRRYLSFTFSESIGSDKKLRGGRRISSLSQALNPLKKEVPKKDYNKLINISTLLMGIDALLVCKDVCGLTNKQADSTLKWGIDMILKGMLDSKN